MQRVDPHIAGEEEVEAAEPQELAAVAGHGSLQEAQGALTEHAHCDCSRRSPTSPPPPGPSLEPMNPSSLISRVAAFLPLPASPLMPTGWQDRLQAPPQLNPSVSR